MLETDSKATNIAPEQNMKMVQLDEEQFFKIANYDRMRPFFMSIVSDSNHWMFISSNGGLSAGRKNPQYSLFPYHTEDKITDFADITGSKTIIQIHQENRKLVWEPFSDRFSENYALSRNLYKSIYGNKILFEEINHDLGLVFRYKWSSSDQYGFVRKASVINTSSVNVKITLLDGIQNIMPHGVPSDLQRGSSNLVDAYKRSELDKASGLGIFSLSAIIVDKAEPSEALKANVVWSIGFNPDGYLLSSRQLPEFRMGKNINPEYDIKGEKGAYFLLKTLELQANDLIEWRMVANVNQTHAQIVSLIQELNRDPALAIKVQQDVDLGTARLVALVAAADGLQCSGDKLNDARHYSNVLFNIMRGGIFDDNFNIEKQDLVNYLQKANREVFSQNRPLLDQLPAKISRSALKTFIKDNVDVDLARLVIEYLPLKFSRRHGDPSRPWNNFSINTKDEKDGAKILDYEGNWRDIFQNWEALAHAYPEFIEGMIFKFLNASTFDGYNPYRVTKDGFDWETIEPDNPWSYIGYWGDHQIIYLQKFLEIIEYFYPNTLVHYFDKSLFVYAAVPYKIKPYNDLVKNPKDTIEFDEDWDTSIRRLREQMGSDGALLMSDMNGIYHVNLIEKLLATILAKVSNFIPEAGIWMNTQRPEWNDANNALVGNGASMVTLYYLHRFLKFFQKMLDKSGAESFKVSSELIEFYHSIRQVLSDYAHVLADRFSDQDRKQMVNALGKAASDYRQHIYKNGFWGKKRSVSLEGLQNFTQLSLDFIEHSILANQREDKLYHAYNLITFDKVGLSVSHLSEMLEGQVAVLSSGYLNGKEALEVLDALKASVLFRPDQYSYILYPNEDLPGFLRKNVVPKAKVEQSALLMQLLADGNSALIEADCAGNYHFNGDFKNANDLNLAMLAMQEGPYAEEVKKDKKQILSLFEEVFNHKAFTGRSGTFFAYEGLGSIYWHMVSKLHLAVQECCLHAIANGDDPETVGKLLEHYYEIDAGIGVHKSPELYGAFPTDPYSHTPMHKGAQQPGMTGQVKEDILVRFGELGVFVDDGKLHFNPCLLRKDEFIEEPMPCALINLDGKPEESYLQEGMLSFTYCQVPVVYQLAQQAKIEVSFKGGSVKEYLTNALDETTSNKIFQRTGEVIGIKVWVDERILK